MSHHVQVGIPHFAHGGGHKVEATVDTNDGVLPSSLVYVYELCVCMYNGVKRRRESCSCVKHREKHRERARES